MDTFLEVLKWTGLVLAAGFVGYFGRHFAKVLIARINRNKEMPAVNQESSVPPEVAIEEVKAKVEKKKSKAEVKRSKKSGE